MLEQALQRSHLSRHYVTFTCRENAAERRYQTLQVFPSLKMMIVLS
jgi:hypothetical protein